MAPKVIFSAISCSDQVKIAKLKEKVNTIFVHYFLTIMKQKQSAIE